MRIAVLGLAAFLAACSTSKTEGTPSPESDAGDAGSAFTFKPQSCGYTVAPEGTRLFADYALDTATPGGAPVRVRLGLGGGTASNAEGYADPSKATSSAGWRTVRAASSGGSSGRTTAAAPPAPRETARTTAVRRAWTWDRVTGHLQGS